MSQTVITIRTAAMDLVGPFPIMTSRFTSSFSSSMGYNHRLNDCLKSIHYNNDALVTIQLQALTSSNTAKGKF